MPNTPVQRGTSFRVKWKHPATREWQSKTLSCYDTVKQNEDAAWALYSWLRERNDAVLQKDPVIVQHGFLRPTQPLYAMPSGAPTFRELALEVIAMEGHVAEETRVRHKAWIGNHFADLAEIPVDEITDLMLSAKAAAIRGYASSSSYCNYMAFAKRVFARAVKKGFLPGASPMEDLVVRKTKTAPLSIMTHAEFAILMLAAVVPQVRDMMLFMIRTGCRIGEVLALQCGDFRLDGDAPDVFIQRAVPNSSSAPMGLPKGGKCRPVILDPATADYFRKLIAGRPAGDPVFPRASGGHWKYMDWRLQQWLPVVARAIELGFDNARIQIRPHGLRHTYASWLLADGCDIRALADQLGHEDPAFTLRRYIHTTKHGTERMRAILATQASAFPLLAE